jgi:Tfp pilus assembly protein PilX
MLVVLTLAGLALHRQASSGVLVAANISFRKAALIAADLGIESARGMLAGAGFISTGYAAGYFAAWCHNGQDGTSGKYFPGGSASAQDDCTGQPAFDPLTYGWGNAKLVTADDGNGNSIDYIVHRLCTKEGVTGADNPCVTHSGTGGNSGREEFSYGSRDISGTDIYYYRITVRTKGPRNTVAYSQATVY